MTVSVRLFNRDERPPSPSDVKQMVMRCEPDCPQDELLVMLINSLKLNAEWWAEARAGTPPDIAKMLEVEVRRCGEPRFVSELEVRRIAARGFMEHINRQRGYAYATEADALADPADFKKELSEWEGQLASKAERFHFGIDALDGALNGGIVQGQLLSIIGNPGAMKTSLLLNGIERWVAETSEAVVFFSLDMSKADIYERLLLREMGCGRDALRDHVRRKSAEYAAAKEAIGERYSGRLWVFENRPREPWTIEKVREHVEYTTPGLFAIDFLTLLKKPKQSDFEVTNEAMPVLKELAHYYGCAGVVLSQMSMESRRIQMAGGMGGSAKGGGVVEETVDAEIELFRDISNDPLDSSPRIVATIKKARMGIAGASYQLDYSGPRMEFTGTAHRVYKAKAAKPIFDTI